MTEENNDRVLMTDHEFREWLSTFHSLCYGIMNRGTVSCTESVKILSEFAFRFQPHHEAEFLRLIKETTRVHDKQRRRVMKKRLCGQNRYYQSYNYNQFGYLFEGSNPNLIMKIVGRCVSSNLLQKLQNGDACKIKTASFVTNVFCSCYGSSQKTNK